LIGKAVTLPVTLIEDDPIALFTLAAADVLVGDAARAAHRRRHGESLGESRPACQLRFSRDCALLKNGHAVENSIQRSSVEKACFLGVSVEKACRASKNRVF
jgi:hypothetical protein